MAIDLGRKRSGIAVTDPLQIIANGLTTVESHNGMTFTDQPGGIMDESSHGHNAGYTLLGRMFALGQVQGILATVDRELGIEYKQPGFFD